jgi:hypothetical protein
MMRALVFVAVAGALAGCQDYTEYGGQYPVPPGLEAQAERICAPYGGLRVYYPPEEFITSHGTKYRARAWCNDNTYVQFWKEKK